MQKILQTIDLWLAKIPQSLRLSISFAIVYIILIFLFAFLYRIFGLVVEVSINETRDANIFDCIYFSVVTITTLGYGDISPFGFIQKTLVIFETLLGVFAFGLFLTAIGYELSNRQNRIEKRSEENRRKLYLAGFYRKISEHISAFLNLHNHATRDRDEFERYVFSDTHVLEIGPFLFDEKAITRITEGLISNNPGMSPNTTADVFFQHAELLKNNIIEELDRYRVSIEDVNEIRRTEDLIDYLNRVRKTMNYGGVSSSEGQVNLQVNEQWISLMRNIESIYADVIKTRAHYLSQGRKVKKDTNNVSSHDEVDENNFFVSWIKNYLNF